VITLQEPHSEFVYLLLTEANFTDIESVVDGSDVFFMGPDGACLPYAVMHFDKELRELHVAVNPQGNTVIYMGYGGENPCAGTG
jgi:hypothetical protein